jgi:bacitracin synthase 3
MTAAYMILLSKICGTKDCTVGMPVNTRNYDNFDNAIGLYLNTVAVRVNVDGDKTNKEILKDVALNTENALKYQCYPMERLIEKLHMTSKDNTMPLFETIFNYTTVEQEHLEGNLLESEETEYNLTWYVREIDNRILIRACYKKGLYTKEAIQYMVEEYTKILENMCHNADGLIREYKLSIRQEHKRNRVTIKR